MSALSLSRSLRRLLRRGVRRLGVDLCWYTYPTLLDRLELDLVLDVGANTGQFAQELRDTGYSGAIVSFEPLSEAHAELIRRSSSDKLWTIAPRMALGERCATVSQNVADYS